MAMSELLLNLPFAQHMSVTGEAATGPEGPDLEDIQAVLRGERERFARLVERYQHTISTYMWRFTRDPAQCEELVQEVFVEAYFSLGKFRAEAPFLHWLRVIATRTGYRYWKRRAHERTQVEAREALAREPRTMRDSGAERAERAELVHAALETLPPRDRVVLVLLYLEGLSAGEAAQRLGWNATLVRVQAHRARQKLKLALEKMQEHEHEDR